MSHLGIVLVVAQAPELVEQSIPFFSSRVDDLLHCRSVSMHPKQVPGHFAANSFCAEETEIIFVVVTLSGSFFPINGHRD
jgi:hypothetical protein